MSNNTVVNRKVRIVILSLRYEGEESQASGTMVGTSSKVKQGLEGLRFFTAFRMTYQTSILAFIGCAICYIRRAICYMNCSRLSAQGGKAVTPGCEVERFKGLGYSQRVFPAKATGDSVI